MKIFSLFKKLDFWIVFSVFVLSILSLISLYSIGKTKNDFYNFKKQILFFIIGFFLMFTLSFFDWQFLKDHQIFFLFLYFLSLFLIFILLLFGKPVRGVKIWYRIGVFNFDPSELLKISLIFFFAYYFSKKHVELYDLKNIIFSGLFLFLPAIFLSYQPNLGAFLVLVFCWFSVLIFSGIRLREFFILLFLGLIIFVFAWEKLFLPYQKTRIISFLFPQTSDTLNASWSQRQSKIAIANGGFWGRGIFQGEQKNLGFLTEPETDFIFSAIVEEMGFASALIIFLCFFILILRILKLSYFHSSNFIKLVGVGTSAQLFIYFFVHVGMNLGLLPVVGLSLPFLSYGGSLLLSNFILLGILQGARRF